MIDQLAKLLEAITEGTARGPNIDARIVSLLAAEVRKRLELERALIEYLKNAPANPYSASAYLLEWLERDEESEKPVY